MPIFAINQTSKLFVSYLDKEMKALNLNKSQWRIMGYLNFFKTINQSELASLLGLSKAMLGQIIHKFEEKDWVTRKISSVDRRSYDLTLTPRVKKIGSLLGAIMVMESDRILDGFSEREKREVENYLMRMTKNLEELPETPALKKLRKDLVEELKNLEEG
ncbi:MAG: MarR family transcriptional regulator [Porticoccaceae bacterium]